MKLGKEEIQKLALGVILLLGLIYAYFSMLLGPMTTRQTLIRAEITALEPKIATAKSDVMQAQSVEASVPEAKATVAQISAMIPEGSPVAWFPPRIADFFKARGVEKATTRMNTETPEKELPGFRRISWGVEFAKIDFLAFAAAISELENDEPLLQIISLQIESGREEVEEQRALLTINNLVKQ